MSGSAGLYSFLLFLPLVLRLGLGYSQTMSYLLSVPPSAVAVVFTAAVTYFSDKFKIRGPFVLLQGASAILGLGMIGFLDGNTGRYLGAFFASCGSNSLLVTAGAWQQNNVRGDAKRAVLSAVQVSCGAFGGIYSALVFRQQVSNED